MSNEVCHFLAMGEEQFEKDKFLALSSGKDTQRVQWVDIAKGIAIICVIIGHTVPHGPLRSALFSFHLPVFFVLSGFTTRLKPVSSMLPSLIRRLIVPYIMLTAGSRLIAAALGVEPLLAPLIFIQSLVWGSGVAVNGIPPVGASWFLVCMFFARLLFVGVSNKMTSLGWHKLSQCITWVVLLIMVVVLHYFDIWLPLSLDNVPVATFLMWCGYSIKTAGIDWKIVLKPIPLIALASLWMAGVKLSDGNTPHESGYCICRYRLTGDHSYHGGINFIRSIFPIFIFSISVVR